ncbi:43-like isoform X4 [Octopus vulgaris]|uniref:43-like isoform X4 n=1 Tax=Octopus vulgaris TaxID=6645 RepID=A0AA36F9N2_OCTVU|nr:43-like isoform X4 [Octopus vulgaris]
MSTSEDDNELRDLLVQTLESNGTLAKIRAQLRASVFLALEKQEPSQNKAPLLNAKLKAFLNTKDGHLAAVLVHEFLEFFNMEFTGVVFDAETGVNFEKGQRNVLLKDLHLPNDFDSVKSSPVLSQAIKQIGKNSVAETDNKNQIVPNGLPESCIAEAKKKFDLYDKAHQQSVEKADVTNIFCELFPHFHRSILERFVQEECHNAEKGNSQRYFCLMPKDINFDEFLTMYKHLFEYCKRVVLKSYVLEEKNIGETPAVKNNKLPAVNNSTNRTLDHKLGNGFTKFDGSVNRKADSFSLSSDWNNIKSSDSKALTQQSMSLNSLLPDTPEEDPFFDDPFLPTSPGLKALSRDTNWGQKTTAADDCTLFQAKPVTFVPKLSNSTKENNEILNKDPLTNLNKKVVDLKFVEASGSDKNNITTTTTNTTTTEDDDDDDDDYDEDFASEDTNRSRFEGKVKITGGSIVEEIEEELDLSQELSKSENSELADLTTDKTLSQPDTPFDYMEDVLSS